MIAQCTELKDFLEGRVNISDPLEMMQLFHALPHHFVTCPSCFKTARERILVGLPLYWISSGEGVHLSLN